MTVLLNSLMYVSVGAYYNFNHFVRQDDKAPSTFPPFSSNSRLGSQRGRNTFLVSCCPNLFSSPHVHVNHTTPVSASCTHHMYYSGGVIKLCACQCQSCGFSVSARSTLTMYCHSNALIQEYFAFSI